MSQQDVLNMFMLLLEDDAPPPPPGVFRYTVTIGVANQLWGYTTNPARGSISPDPPLFEGHAILDLFYHGGLDAILINIGTGTVVPTSIKIGDKTFGPFTQFSGPTYSTARDITVNPFPNEAGSTVVVELTSPNVPPPPSTNLLEETLNSVTIAANRAWGVFNTLNWTFSHGGTDYTINGWFTDQNGLHIRFANQTQALAFIAAGLTVKSGITGAPDIDSSEMVNAPAIDARTGPSFTQRYANGVQYTVEITD